MGRIVDIVYDTGCVIDDFLDEFLIFGVALVDGAAEFLGVPQEIDQPV